LIIAIAGTTVRECGLANYADGKEYQNRKAATPIAVSSTRVGHSTGLRVDRQYSFLGIRQITIQPSENESRIGSLIIASAPYCGLCPDPVP